MENTFSPFEKKAQRHLAHHLLNAALLDSDAATVLAFVRGHLDDHNLAYPQRIILALAHGERRLLADPPVEVYTSYPELVMLVDYVLERGDRTEADMLCAARRLLALP